MPAVNTEYRTKEDIIKKIKQLQRFRSPKHLPSIVYLKSLVGWNISSYDLYLAKSVACKRPNYYEDATGGFKDIFSKEELNNHLSYVLNESMKIYDIRKKFSDLMFVKSCVYFESVKKPIKDGFLLYSELLDKADHFWSEFVEVFIFVLLKGEYKKAEYLSCRFLDNFKSELYDKYLNYKFRKYYFRVLTFSDKREEILEDLKSIVDSGIILDCSIKKNLKGMDCIYFYVNTLEEIRNVTSIFMSKGYLSKDLKDEYEDIPFGGKGYGYLMLHDFRDLKTRKWVYKDINHHSSRKNSLIICGFLKG